MGTDKIKEKSIPQIEAVHQESTIAHSTHVEAISSFESKEEVNVHQESKHGITKETSPFERGDTLFELKKAEPVVHGEITFGT